MLINVYREQETTFHIPGEKRGAHSCEAFHGAFCLNDCHRINTVAAALTRNPIINLKFRDASPLRSVLAERLSQNNLRTANETRSNLRS